MHKGDPRPLCDADHHRWSHWIRLADGCWRRVCLTCYKLQTTSPEDGEKQPENKEQKP